MIHLPTELWGQICSYVPNFPSKAILVETRDSQYWDIKNNLVGTIFQAAMESIEESRQNLSNDAKAHLCIKKVDSFLNHLRLDDKEWKEYGFDPKKALGSCTFEQKAKMAEVIMQEEIETLLSFAEHIADIHPPAAEFLQNLPPVLIPAERANRFREWLNENHPLIPLNDVGFFGLHIPDEISLFYPTFAEKDLSYLFHDLMHAPNWQRVFRRLLIDHPEDPKIFQAFFFTAAHKNRLDILKELASHPQFNTAQSLSRVIFGEEDWYFAALKSAARSESIEVINYLSTTTRAQEITRKDIEHFIGYSSLSYASIKALIQWPVMASMTPDEFIDTFPNSISIAANFWPQVKKMSTEQFTAILSRVYRPETIRYLASWPQAKQVSKYNLWHIYISRLAWWFDSNYESFFEAFHETFGTSFFEPSSWLAYLVEKSLIGSSVSLFP